MTLLTTNAAITYNGSLGQDTFAYNFRVDNKTDMNVVINEVLQGQGEWTIAGLGNASGGIVTLNTPLTEAAIVTLAREVPATQEVDYQPFDAFPAETHEQALDKLTMLVQQSGDVTLRGIRFPLGDPANPILPGQLARAHKYIFFDDEGNVTVAEGTVAEGDYVKTVTILQDGALNSPIMLGVDNSDINNPKIFVRPTNVGAGLVQLINGKVPSELLDISVFRTLGFFRGDDECPKLLTDPGCVDPDYRNPTQLLGGPYQHGDLYVVTFGAAGDPTPPTDGSINLLVDDETGVTQVVLTKNGDSIVYLTDTIADNGHRYFEGWYLWPGAVASGNASDIAYDPTGDKIILPTSTNVNLALKDLDAAVDVNKTGIVQANANAIAMALALGG